MDTIVMKAGSSKVSKFQLFRLTRRDLPIVDEAVVSDERVEASDVHVDDRLLTKDGHWVQVVDLKPGFMDVSCLTEFSNGALRWLSLERDPFRKPVEVVGK